VPFQLENKLFHEAVDDLLGRGIDIVAGFVESADGAGKPGDGAAAAEALALHKADAQPLSGRRHGRADTGRTATDNQHVETALNQPAGIACHVSLNFRNRR
jgi:hypothetical protein